MRFGFLTYGLDRPLSGISRSVIELGRALVRRPNVTPFFLTPYSRGPFIGQGNLGSVMPMARLLPAFMTLGALQLPIVARKHDLALIHDPAGVSPFLLPRALGPYKRIVTLHDAIAFRYPGGYSLLNTLLHRAYIPRTLANVDAVVTPSHAAGKDLTYFLDLPPSKIHVVPWAADPAFQPLDRSAALAVAARYDLAPPFVLSVGGLQARKNLPALLAALSLARHTIPHLTLAIVGRPMWNYTTLPEAVERLGLASAVRFTGHVRDADLPALYNAAAALCMPSLYEGFGLPILEAMACGTPVVCSTAPALVEVAGNAALCVAPHDHAALAEAIGQAVEDRALADDLRARGLARAASFSWERTAQQTIDVYKHVLAQP
jgi:glycosyltransferase involved in cell wall biosynthesis